MCLNGYCGPDNNLTQTDGSPCSGDAVCQTGWVCFQGQCAQPPNNCNFHTECLSDDAVCQDGYCTWPGDTNKTCTIYTGDRWHCPTEQDCGDKVGICSIGIPGGQACSYYVDGVQQNWRCELDETCGMSSDECL